jgi:hypothetical protein
MVIVNVETHRPVVGGLQDDDQLQSFGGVERTGPGRLFHISEDPSIERFEPRPVAVSSPRAHGMEWLNGPLVWAVSEERQATYLFPRDCPRILLWLTDDTTKEDREMWWGDRCCSMIVHIEWRWFERIQETRLYRYELPSAPFQPIEGGWMWVSKTAVEPVGVEQIDDLFDALKHEGVELRVMESLTPIRGAWQTTLHASGMRLWNAANWPGGT